jgi:hypothetical protein
MLNFLSWSAALGAVLLFAQDGRADAPTYHRDIAPLFKAKCLGCHGEIPQGAPFSLHEYAEATRPGRPGLIRSAVQARRMPPFLVDNSGACGKFPEHLWLTENEIKTVSDWVAAGTPEGNPVDMPLAFEASRSRFSPTETVSMPGSYVPSGAAGRPDDYRCFLIDAPVNEDKFLTAYKLIPGNPKVVHHAILFIPVVPQAVAAAEALDARDAKLGYECFGSAGVPALPAIAWAPGSGVVEYPSGTGVRMPAGRKLILQVHYSLTGYHGGHSHGDAPAAPAGTPDPDRTSIQMQLERTVAREAKILLPGETVGPVIPARQDRYPFTKAFTVSASGGRTTQGVPIPALQPFDLYGVLPHMHKYGKDSRLEIVRKDSDVNSCLMNVPRWNFNQQHFYFYKKPVPINDGDQLVVNCSYNTSASAEPVPFGDFTQQEMCLIGLYVVWRD